MTPTPHRRPGGERASPPKDGAPVVALAVKRAIASLSTTPAPARVWGPAAFWGGGG